MNESETRAELIDPKLKQSGWGEIEETKIHREFHITTGRIQTDGTRAKPEIADYILSYKNQKLAAVEAKSAEVSYSEGVQQAKDYASKLKLDYTYSSNGKEVYEICLKTGEERIVDSFPTPEELWNRIYSDYNSWRENFSTIPFEDVNGTKSARYYQEIAVNRVMEAVAEEKTRILLTLATGTGKTFIAFQIAWKLFQTRWNLNRDGGRRPRILFLSDRNILADQAYSSFAAFPQDALVRISPADIKKKGSVPKNGSIFFTIFQTFMSGPENLPYFGEYTEDFFDLIIIDECHRGGANDESNWRGILDYFSPAVQLGLTATPRRIDNADTYRYFGDPVYIYSLKEGINDGFLTPFKVKRIKTTMDDYIFTSDDEVIEGEIEIGRLYEEKDFNVTIEIQERESARVKIMFENIGVNEKTIIFCANQKHAALIRDLVNQQRKSTDVNYCVRVTSNDGSRGEQYLREFQDNEKTIPTILTTSQKLSTGVDARNVRNIVLLRPVNSMIEFKQIIGRGTRLFEGKSFFTILDFVNAYVLFSDPSWDGEPISEDHIVTTKELETGVKEPRVIIDFPEPPIVPRTVRIKLRDGKEREIQHMISTSFWDMNGKPMSLEEFLDSIFNVLPKFYQTEEELKSIWSDPKKRKELLYQLANLDYSFEKLKSLMSVIKAEKSDLYDLLSYVSFAELPISRQERADKVELFLPENEQSFVEFVLDQYVKGGIKELSEENLPELLKLKYYSAPDAERILGSVDRIREIFFNIQTQLFK
jgi:type I restriction enzyme R subunit